MDLVLTILAVFLASMCFWGLSVYGSRAAPTFSGRIWVAIFFEAAIALMLLIAFCCVINTDDTSSPKMALFGGIIFGLIVPLLATLPWLLNFENREGFHLQYRQLILTLTGLSLALVWTYLIVSISWSAVFESPYW